ncbi:putative transporter ESBP6 [Smittium culicis]|uniref:Putative transporter ESBP6 n=1 Tax=Smittium culicis TaxID=133412 RepID=A0A1R1XQD1_9FUNG|nr:putative transporter ESBP6 [Smittium culicis]
MDTLNNSASNSKHDIYQEAKELDIHGVSKVLDIESKIDKSAAPTIIMDETSYIAPPDKGYAWIIMFACTFNLLLAFGSFNAFGVFQTYYLQVLFPNESASYIAWISTTCGVATFTGGLSASSIIRRLGLRYSSLLGTLICVIGLLSASFSTQVWQLMITQGLVFGYGSSIIINISLTVPALWFDEKRALVYGIVASGGGFGALILIPIINKVIAASGIEWAFRTLCFVYLFVTGIGGFLLKPRSIFVPSDVIIDFKLLKEPTTIALCLVGFFMQIGFNVPALYFPTNLVLIGKTPQQATDYIMVFCTCTGISRALTGYLTRFFKPTTILFVGHILSGIVMLAMWYTSNKFVVLILFYIIFGFVCIPYMTLGPSITSEHFSPENISQVNALCYLAMGLAVLISLPSVGVAFEKLGHKTDFSAIIIIGSVAYFVSALAVIYLRFTLKKPINAEK